MVYYIALEGRTKDNNQLKDNIAVNFCLSLYFGCFVVSLVKPLGRTQGLDGHTIKQTPPSACLVTSHNNKEWIDHHPPPGEPLEVSLRKCLLFNETSRKLLQITTMVHLILLDFRNRRQRNIWRTPSLNFIHAFVTAPRILLLLQFSKEQEDLTNITPFRGEITRVQFSAGIVLRSALCLSLKVGPSWLVAEPRIPRNRLKVLLIMQWHGFCVSC